MIEMICPMCDNLVRVSLENNNIAEPNNTSPTPAAALTTSLDKTRDHRNYIARKRNQSPKNIKRVHNTPAVCYHNWISRQTRIVSPEVEPSPLLEHCGPEGDGSATCGGLQTPGQANKPRTHEQCSL